MITAFSGPSLVAEADALLAPAVAVAVGDLALLRVDVALVALPGLVAVTAAACVVAVSRTQERAHTYIKTKKKSR